MVDVERNAKLNTDAPEAVNAPLTPPLSIPSASKSTTPAQMEEQRTSNTSPPPGLGADSWKAVGSPSRRGSVQHNPIVSPSSPTTSHTSSIIEDDDEVIPRQRNIRTRTTSNPNTNMLNGVDLSPQVLIASSVSSPGGAAESEKWASLGLQWNNRRPSIWGDSHAEDASLEPSASAPREQSSPQRTYRSHSVAVGHSAELLATLAARNRRVMENANERNHPIEEEQPLNEDYDQIDLPKMRNRSKSISTYDPAISQIRDMYSDESDMVDLSSIWSRGQPEGLPHRRSSTTPYGTPWDNHMSGASNSYGMRNDNLDRLRNQRRFSLAPNLHSSEYDSFGNGNLEPPTLAPHLSPRRHSVGGPLAYNPPGRQLAEAFNSLRLDEREPRPNIPYGYSNLLEDVDDVQVEEQRNRSAYNEIGRGIPLHALPSNTKLYIVEFKAGRSDIYYVADSTPSLVVKKGDLVIVEADRGKDLGKVINDSITPHQIHMLQAQQSDALNDLHRINRDIRPKRIYRSAQPQEVQMLVTKSQDEAKAMAVCQTKVRQKRLPMEVVDGEYQWDRRKLTFYFVADRRIDFRELVRDLFKIYKTRIWMCAVNPIPNPYQSLMNAPQDEQLQQ